MASNTGKKSGRVTAKGTRPPDKSPRGAAGKGAAPAAGVDDTPATPTGKSGKGGKGKAAPVEVSPNRQMRRSGHAPEAPDTEKAEKRLRLALIVGAVITVVLVGTCIAVFRLSGTWIGVLGFAAGVGTAFSVITGKGWLADKGRAAAIAIGAFGLVTTAIGISGITDFHWPGAGLIGCALGAMLAELSNQQMTAPEDPPAAAITLLRRTGAQHLPAPSTGNCVWATRAGRIHIIVGARPKEGVSGDELWRDKQVQRSRQRGELVLRRMAGMGVEPGVTIVVDSAGTSVRDGNDTICSPAGLTKALNR